MPSSPLLITSLGLVTPFGAGWERFRTAVQRGECAVSAEGIPESVRPWLRLAAAVKEEGGGGGDRAGRWLSLAADEALRYETRSGAGLPPPERRAMVFATTLGGLPRHLEPAAERVAGSLACEAPALPIARRLETRGAFETINVACASGLAALARAGELIATGDAETVWVAGADALTRMTAAGFASLQVLAPDLVRPFDRDRRGMALGEAAVVLRVATPSEWGATRKRRAGDGLGPAPARLLGWGLTSDALHLTAPDPSGTGLARAAREALSRAGLVPEAIGAVIVSGTGTIQSDRADAAALRLVFGDSIPPFTAPKSLYGHTLGPAGLLDAATAVAALESGFLPPTRGFARPDPECSGVAPVTVPTPLRGGGPVLIMHSAFGGQNAAVVLATGR